MDITRRISVVGLGKVGASMAAAIASRGHEVIGVDVNHRAVDALNRGDAPVQETGLQALIEANRARLCATMSHAEAVRDTELTFVIVPTPSDHSGTFSLQYAGLAFREIGKALAAKHERHTVVLTSTVLRGATRHGLLPVLGHHLGRKGASTSGVLQPGIRCARLRHPRFPEPGLLLIGELDPSFGEHLESCYCDIMKPSVHIRRMTLENAELAKSSS